MDIRRYAPGLLFSVLVLAAAIAVRAADPAISSAMRGAGFDTLQRMWPRKLQQPANVRVVDIDEPSLKKRGQWPWPRKDLAKLVERLSDLGAAAIVFDIVFPEPDRVSPRQIASDPDFRKIITQAGGSVDPLNWPDSDAVFAASMNNRPVVLAFATAADGQGTKVPVKSGFAQTGQSAIDAPQRLQSTTHNLKALDDAAAGIGGINLDLWSTQGVARQIPMLWSDGEKYYPSLVLEALRVGQGASNIVVHGSEARSDAITGISVGAFDIPVSETGLFTLYYRADTRDLFVSAADVLGGTHDDALAPQLEGNIVFIGTSATGLLDNRTTALGESIAGVAIHAQATEQIITGSFLGRPEWTADAEFLVTGMLGLLVAFLCARFRPALPFAVTAATAMGILATVVIGFRSFAMLFDATFPLLAIGLTFLAGTAWKLLVTDKQGREMRRAFGHYVAPSILSEIERRPESLQLGGEVRDVTVMFADIADFTPLSEALSAEELVQTVNALWEVCSKAILETEGTIDKFIGDAVMAFWNAPIAVDGHQGKAAAAALKMRAGLKQFNQSAPVAALLRKHSLPPIALRIGIASGKAAVGNMGSLERFDYSVLGDTVNVAARAESVCKRLGHDIAIAGTLAPETQALAVLEAGSASLKGKSEPAPVHIIVGDADHKSSPAFATIQAEHDYIINKLLRPSSRRNGETLKQLVAELANRHPQLENYFKALPERASDFAIAPAKKPGLKSV